MSDNLKTVRPVIFVTAILLASCTSAPPPVPTARPDPVTEAWYGQTVEELAALNGDAGRLFRDRKLDESAALIAKGETLVSRLLGVPRPTLAAMEAASDLDDLYGRMLIAN